jgi:hypothetical protein
MRCILLASIVLGTAVVVPAAGASQVISTSSVSDLTLGVNDRGEAMLSYRSGGKSVHVLAWGAVNATAPVARGKQVAFTLEYDGGYEKYYEENPVAKAALARLRHLQRQMAQWTAAGNNPRRYALAPRLAAAYKELRGLRIAAEDYWKTFTCPAYHGPRLAWQVAACTAPDGSDWAVQEWQRQLPDYGVDPTPKQAAWEVHLSHWTGALPVLTVHSNWAYARRYDHLFGTFTYDGTGVYGFRSTRNGEPLDSFGRNLYLDTFDSAYGAGWRRENSFLTHKYGGSFCYGFYPHGSHPAGKGTEYRAIIIGPGVTPDVMWHGNAPGPYNPWIQAISDLAILGLNDPQCKPV